MIGPTAPRAHIGRLVSETFGRTVEVTWIDAIEPWAVARCGLDSSSGGVPATVVAKWGSRGTVWAEGGGERTVTEWVALQFAAGLRTRRVAGVVAADAKHGLLVLEDLAPRVPLLHLIRESSHGASRDGVTAFAVELASMSAASIGRHGEFHSALARRGVSRASEAESTGLDPKWREAIGYATDLGAALPPRAESELLRVADVLRDSGPFLTFSSGDAGVNNFLVDPADRSFADGRFIDFEYAGYRHALVDAMCLYVPPPAWITVGDPVRDGTEDAYRSVLSRAVAQAQDDELFGLGLSGAGCAWAIARLRRFMLMDGRPSGHHSRVQMVSTLESAAATAEDHDALPHLAGWCRAAADALRRRWPDADVDLTALGRYAPRL